MFRTDSALFCFTLKFEWGAFYFYLFIANFFATQIIDGAKELPAYL